MTLLLLFLSACRPEPACAGDADCDGVPDLFDRCSQSNGEPTDAAGCTDDQMAGCAVVVDAPDDCERADSPVDFRWHGNCDVYLLQFSDDSGFAAGRTRTEVRTTTGEHETQASEPYWRVVGGHEGSSRAFTSEPREIRWR